MHKENGLHGLRVWQDSRSLARLVYVISADFPQSEQYGLVSQIRRASVSVMSNIAEGSGRYSRREFIHFLHIARGSLMEVRSLSILACDLGFLQECALDETEKSCDSIGISLNALIRSLAKLSSSPQKVQ